MAERKGGIVWSDEMTRSLLDHVDRHCGPKGLYMVDRPRAFREATDWVSAQEGSLSVTKRQVFNKLNHLLNHRNQRNRRRRANSLYMEGSSALSESYLEKCGWPSRIMSNAAGRVELSGDRKSSIPQASLLPTEQGRLAKDIASRRIQGERVELDDLGGHKKYKSTEARVKRSRPGDQSHKAARAGPSDPTTPYIESSHIGNDAVIPEASVPSTTSSLSSLPLSDISLPGNDSFSIDLPGASIVPRTCTTPEPAWLAELQGYLNKSQDRYVPTTQMLCELREDLVVHVSIAVGELFTGSAGRQSRTDTRLLYDRRKRPKLGQALSDKESLKICRHVFGAGSIDELNNRAAQTCLFLDDFLRALVTSAISQWVFEGHYVELLGHLDDKLEISLIYEELVAAVCPKLHEQVSAHSKHVLIVERKLKTHSQAIQLAQKLGDALIPFLTDNDFPDCGPPLVQWNRDLIEAFEKALQLKGQTMLLGRDFGFRWPRFDSTFEAAIMELADETRNTSGDDSRVKLAFFPCLAQVGYEEERKVRIGRVVLRALVELQ